ncbi:MAG: YlxP-like protein, partial [uncultured Acidimicrobiales bacterium]
CTWQSCSSNCTSPPADRSRRSGPHCDRSSRASATGSRYRWRRSATRTSGSGLSSAWPWCPTPTATRSRWWTTWSAGCGASPRSRSAASRRPGRTGS